MILINLTVKHNSKQDCVQELDSESLSICVASEAKNGEANTNVVELMSDVLKVKKYQVDLVRGHKSHDKVVSISDTSYSIEQIIGLIQMYIEQ